ncbi:fatty acyl-CoA reductase 2-like [Suncus etruscus]|uniref:fatty acyl-CoA reductase 2-like n=1 Tax=Suncus etruscus TaxID=109475 RepID=UPI00210FB771|nr:fatty acyl-CoA reductase 2-like [Suncus etruscus]
MSRIATYYEGKSILITGATGFLGKVLLEKLLRTSPKLKVIYILMRPKAGQTLQQRVDQMLNCKLFDKVREACPNMQKKIRAIYADLKHQDLGISEEDLQELLKSTNLVFHCAATVRFNDSLRNSVQINIIATQQLLRMASQMTSLEAFIYISTAYSNCNRKHIDEVVYPCPVEPRQIIASMEWLDDAIIDKITPKLLGEWPNSYTYTKALAEMVVQAEGQNLNMAIVRPSIVSATWQEPFPGWVDNLNGPNAVIIAAGKGLLRSMKVSPRGMTEFIPVDIVINLILSVGWYTAVHRPKSTQIYHCTTGALNPYKLTDMGVQFMATLKKVPLERAFRIPNVSFNTSTSTFFIEYWNAVNHWGPAAIYDLFLLLTGRKPRILNIMNRILKTISMLEYFWTHCWEWSMKNTEMLMAELSPEDQQVFNFDVRQLDWLEYIENYVIGVKQYLLKEDMSGIPKAKEHLKKLWNMQYLFKAALVLLTWYLLITHSQVVQNTWFFFVNCGDKLLTYLWESSPFKI